MTDLKQVNVGLATYIRRLAMGCDLTSCDKDRQRYQGHLAMAARMFDFLQTPQSISDLKMLVAYEHDKFKQDPLLGTRGVHVEVGFTLFTASVDSLDDAC